MADPVIPILAVSEAEIVAVERELSDAYDPPTEAPLSPDRYHRAVSVACLEAAANARLENALGDSRR